MTERDIHHHDEHIFRGHDLPEDFQTGKSAFVRSMSHKALRKVGRRGLCRLTVLSATMFTVNYCASGRYLS